LFTRLQNRNASTGIDAVYFNPAGLTKLGKEFALYLVTPENVGLWGGKEPKTKQFKAE
jgi:hypothetical protein